MKQFFKSIFYIPTHTKSTDGNITRLLMPSVMGVILCAVCLAGLTLAWFTAGIETAPQTITAVNFDVSVSISDQGTDKQPEDNGEYSLNGNVAYDITLTALGNASTGYCIVETGNASYRTIQLSKGDTLQFTLIPAEDGRYTFIPVWGTSTIKADIQPDAVIGNQNRAVRLSPDVSEQTEESKVPESKPEVQIADEESSQPASSIPDPVTVSDVSSSESQIESTESTDTAIVRTADSFDESVDSQV